MTLGTKRQPISLESDGEAGECHRPRKAARMRRLAARDRPRIDPNNSDGSETLGEESDRDTQRQRRGGANVRTADAPVITTSSNSYLASPPPLPVLPTPRDSSSNFNEDDYMDDEHFKFLLRRMKINDKPARNHLSKPESQPFETIHKDYKVGAQLYRPGKNVELNNGTFLRILSIVEIQGKVLLRGRHFKRCETMNGLFPRRTNEICLNVDVSSEEYSHGARSMISEFPVSEVKRFRMIRMTNHQYRDMSFKAIGSDKATEGYLFCRYKHLKVWKGQKHPEEEAIISLNFDEADNGYGIEPKILRENWRGATTPGGSGSRQAGQNHSIVTNISRYYTFGDGFCGAGGVSCGAQLAGLQVSWGFDKSEHAMSSYRRNYPDTICETSEIADFLTNPPEDIIVDIIHCSPPCQTFSPAKTIAGPDDDANEACIFSVRQVLEKGKPRIFTMEETSGLKERHEEFLNATIHTFVELGYSARWKLVDCSSYGVPQKRKRLVVIASGPGEALPPFPKPTHGPPEAGLRPFNTIGSMISSIPTNAENHDLHSMRRFDPPKRPYHPTKLAKTITCGGGENYHPSGERSFTTREFACLQTFPNDYQFGKVEIRKQIGNAVPPMLAQALYREIKKSLEKTDGLR